MISAANVFGSYPEQYYGPRLPDGCIEIEAYIPEGWYLDRYPWSSPSPEENIFWFGTLCVEGDVAIIEFTELGPRRCRPAPWGTIEDEPICFSSWTLDIENDRHVMPWDPEFDVDWGFYIAQVFMGDWIWFYESLSVDESRNFFVFVQGAFEFITPLWYVESDEYSRWKFKVKERSVETKVQMYRLPGGRRGQ
jgi:hypothetical protein